MASLDDLLACMAARRGHFALESGHHGELWLDVDRLFVQPALLEPFVTQLADKLASHDAEVICGPLTGGAFLAQLVAQQLGVDFVFANRVEHTDSTKLYSVEYPIPPELVEFLRGKRVAVVNDVINAGSAVRGVLTSLQSCKAGLTVIGALLVLGDSAEELAKRAGVPLESLAHLANPLWSPADCPLCAVGTPFDRP